jgi:hypothetical protein
MARAAIAIAPVALALAVLAFDAAGCAGIATAGGSVRGVIAGEVVGGLGGPIAGAVVSTLPPTRQVVTDSAGAFVIDGVEPGEYVVAVTRDGASVSVRRRVREAPIPFTVRLPIWKLEWSDEFDGDTLDETRWKIHEGPSGVEDHLQRYRRSALSLRDGHLRITTVPDSLEPGYYAGALIQSRRMFTYGRFEVRAKLPTGQGMWPGLWLWSNADAPELDIMEMLGGNPRRFFATYHYGNWRGARRSRAASFIGPDLSRAYHVYALEWYPGECRWYFDGVEVFRTPLLQRDEPLSFVIDTMVGGAWGGAPDETTTFPQYHDVDWARIYSAVE